MKKRFLSLVLALAMVVSLFAGMGITASAAGSFIDITQEANLTVTNKIANSYYVQGLREYHEQKDANNYTKFFGQWAWVLSESDARAKLNELMRSPSSMDSQSSTLSVSSPNNEPANFLLNGEKADTLLIWAKAHPLSVNADSYYYAILPMPKEITFTTNLNSSYSISSVDSKTLTVEATCADYDGALTYQWYYCGTRNNKANATAIDGATSNSCTVKPATAKESHYYFCRVTAGETVGDSVVAGVYASDPYVYINNTANLYSTCYAVTGKPYTMEITNATTNVVSGELCYQWYRCTDSEGTGAEAIEGATTASFTVPTNAKGTYYYFGKAYLKGDGLENCSDVTMVAEVVVRDAHKITAVGTPNEDGEIIVEGGKFYFTSVNNHLQDDFTCPKDEICRINYEPDDGYTVDKILVYKTGEPETTVELEVWDSDTKKFTMPDFDITVEVTFKEPQPIEKVDLTVDWSRVPSIGVGQNVIDAEFNPYYDWAVFADGAGAVNGPVEGIYFTVKVTDSNKKEICDALASDFNGLTPDNLTDMLEMLGCGDWLHPELLFSINGYVVKEDDVLAIMPIVNPYSGYFPVVGNNPMGAYNGTVTCNGETVSNSAVFGQYDMSMLLPFIEVGKVSDLVAKKNAAETEVFDVFYYDELGYTTGGSYGVMPGIAAEGEEITIRTTPDEGYVVDTVTWQNFIMPSDADGDGVNEVDPDGEGKYTFEMPDSDVIVKVTFKSTATEPENPPTGDSELPGIGDTVVDLSVGNSDIIKVNGGVVTVNVPDADDEDYLYMTMAIPADAGLDAVTSGVMTIVGEEIFDATKLVAAETLDDVLAQTQAYPALYPAPTPPDSYSNLTWDFSGDEPGTYEYDIVVFKVHRDNVLTKTYDSADNNPYNPEANTIYLYCLYGLTAKRVTVTIAGEDEPTNPPTVIVPPIVNVPVSNDENSVDVDATISGNDATIDALDTEKVEQLVGDENASGDVVIDLSGLGRHIDTAGIPKTSLKAIVDAAEDSGNGTEHLVIKLTTATLVIDDGAMRAIVNQADGDIVKFNFDDVGQTRLNAEQKNAIKDMDVRRGFEAYITVNGERISDFQGGEVEILVPYAIPVGEKAAGFSVWYIAEDGTPEKLKSTYDGKEKCFVVTHFSDYVIVYDEDDADVTSCLKDATCPICGYIDTNVSEWYHDGVHYCLENGLMVGMSDDIFAPNGITTRAQIVTILWRMEGSPTVAIAEEFVDVPENSWYYNAIRWASANGIVNGYGDTLVSTFGPDDAITREQMATILWRYAKYKGIDVSVGEDTNILSFEDAFDVSEYAIPAMQWACGSGLIQGIEKNDTMYLDPKGNATRSQSATMIYRFCSEIEK